MAIIDGFCTGETPLATSRYQIGLLAAAAIVALRVGIGLHFYLEGAAKLQNPKPFSAGFLGNAKGPLAGSYKRMVWDADGLYRLNDNAIQPHWDQYRKRITAHYHFDEAAGGQAKETFNDYTRRYAYLVNAKAAEIEQYYAELKRRDANAANPSRELASLRAHDARITKDRTTLIGPILASIDKLGKDLENDLNAMATAEQHKRHGRLAMPKVASRAFDSNFVDRCIPYFDMIVGVCLILGLFTRPAALAGGLFLVSVCLSQWPLAYGATPIFYQTLKCWPCFSSRRSARANLPDSTSSSAVCGARAAAGNSAASSMRRNDKEPFMQLTPEERQVGQDNYNDVLCVSRRDFLKGVVAAGAVSGAGLGAMYFGYEKVANPVRVGVIGTGDEGQRADRRAQPGVRRGRRDLRHSPVQRPSRVSRRLGRATPALPPARA